jgi:DNA-binding NarL/FixJ family response regulator
MAMATCGSPKPLGLVWIKASRSAAVPLRLEKALREQAYVHLEQSPPARCPPSCAILWAQGKDVAPEVRRLLALAPGVPCLVFGLRADLQLARSALKAGARGLVHAGMRPEQIVRAVSLASKGEVVLPRELLEDVAREAPRAGELSLLTSRQMEILELISEGLSNAQIARRLFLSESTVKQHLRGAYKTLGIENRRQAASLFLRNERSSESRP